MEPITDTARVLYVDDDPSFAEMISTVLERETEPLEIATAEGATAGLERLRAEPIDCIVSDYSMPKRDGLEFLRAVREEYEELPFLLLTGKGSEDIASEAISAGVTDYIQKRQGTEHYSLLANRIMNAVEQYRAGRELERRTRELEGLKDRFQSFVKHSPDIITAMNERGEIQFISPAVERVLGYEQEALIGERTIEYVHPEDRPQLKETLSRIMDGESGEEAEGLLSQEYRFKHRDGSWVWMESIAGTGEEHREGGYVINSRDITERKRRERELEQKSDRLEEFAGIVSHDLQTPITIADARLEMAIEECDSEHLPPINDALDRMEEIIDATLTLAREGQVVDVTRPVDLARLADRCFRTVAPPKVTLQVATDRTIQADRERLRHVMENLFANAIEHGGDDVAVRVGDTDAPGFYVADDGPGIPEGEREAIFETGYTLEEGGTGFGLAIVKQIVDAHGWEIDVTESKDGGARFEITGVEI